MQLCQAPGDRSGELLIVIKSATIRMMALTNEHFRAGSGQRRVGHSTIAVKKDRLRSHLPKVDNGAY